MRQGRGCDHFRTGRYSLGGHDFFGTRGGERDGERKSEGAKQTSHVVFVCLQRQGLGSLYRMNLLASLFAWLLIHEVNVTHRIRAM